MNIDTVKLSRLIRSEVCAVLNSGAAEGEVVIGKAHGCEISIRIVARKEDHQGGVSRHRCVTSSMILLAVLFLASCGSPRTPGVAGPGDTRLGQSIQQVEHAHPKWTLEGVQVLPDGREARQYRDWHWSLGAGVAHGAEHHVLYFRSGALESCNEQ